MKAPEREFFCIFKRTHKVYHTMSREKVERNLEIVRLREVEKLTFLKISQRMNITESFASRLYKQTKRKHFTK